MKIGFKVSDQISQYLRQLERTGLYGRSLDQVAEELMMESLRQHAGKLFELTTSGRKESDK
jgi:hypothetical protein